MYRTKSRPLTPAALIAMWRGPAAQLVCVALCFFLLGSARIQAAAVRSNAGFNDNTLPGNDDGSGGPAALGFDANLFGTTYSGIYVNNNGNATFDAPLGEFTPFNLLSTTRVILAPFFADVDIRVGEPVRYGTSTVDGRAAFGINWVDVGYYSAHVDKLNSFQLVLIDRSDIAPGDFDIEFNYDRILWETGNASGGVDGFGGASARAGWSDGSLNAFEIAGAAVNGAYLDDNLVSGLIHNSLNSGVAGRYVFNVRNGDPSVPEPSSVVLLGCGLVGLAFFGLKRRGLRV
jgi:hypothetical protein